MKVLIITSAKNIYFMAGKLFSKRIYIEYSLICKMEVITAKDVELIFEYPMMCYKQPFLKKILRQYLYLSRVKM